jgi:hypothetical protein
VPIDRSDIHICTLGRSRVRKRQVRNRLPSIAWMAICPNSITWGTTVAGMGLISHHTRQALPELVAELSLELRNAQRLP